MIKSIYVALSGYGSDRTALDTAMALAAPFDAVINVRHVRMDAATLASMGALRSATWTLEQSEVERSNRARQAFDEAATRATRAGTKSAFCWDQLVGIETVETCFHARPYDLVVLAREDALPPGRLADIVTGTGRPVVIAPPKPPAAPLARTIAIAWKNSKAAAQAVTGAMPLLRKAEEVLLLTAPEQSAAGDPSAATLAETLAAHGIACEPRVTQAADVSIEDAIRNTVYNNGCDLLVMGAYGHARLKELVLGGVTREILRDCAVPVLLCH